MPINRSQNPKLKPNSQNSATTLKALGSSNHPRHRWHNPNDPSRNLIIIDVQLASCTPYIINVPDEHPTF